MSDEKQTVLEKAAGKCRAAYQAGIPLILIDTEETELAIEVACKSRTVDLLMPVEPGERDQQWLPYYRFFGKLPDELGLCKNFFTDSSRLTQLALQNGDLNRKGIPGLFVLHLTKSSWRKNIETDAAMIPVLRGYAEAYVRCHDRSAPLRSSCVILYGDPGLIPKDLQIYTEIIEVDFPDAQELMALVSEMAEENGTPIELRELVEEVARALAGFQRMEARRMVQRLLWTTTDDGVPLLFTKDWKKLVLDTKKQALIQNGGLLELIKDDAGSEGKEDPASRDNLGAMKNLKRWMGENEARVKHADRFLLHRGVRRPKGILLCGVPGCGKSEAAKILRQVWELPMVRLSVDRLMGSYVGDSERNMRQALKQAEAMAPCIVWIDELDKGFSGSSADSHDNASFKRMFGYFLTWMQENTRPCFIFATANDIGQLPPEMFRSGRFDALFSVFMPTQSECIEIFREHMHRLEKDSRREAERWGIESTALFEEGCFADSVMERIMAIFLDPITLDINKNTKFVNGADIEKIVQTSMMRIRNVDSIDPKADPAKIEERLRLAAPVKPSEWIEAVRDVIQDTTTGTYGGSAANLDSITACVIRLLRGSFVPAGEELIDKNAYKSYTDEKTGEPVVKYEPKQDYLRSLSSYDEALHRAISKRIEYIGRLMESSELKKLL